MTEPWTYEVRQGGLMRCCIGSLSEQMSVRLAAGKGPPQEGDRISCAYCSEPMHFTDGAWEWGRS